MATERKMTAELIAWQTRGFRPFTETIEVLIKSGKDSGNFPADHDLRSDATQIIGMRAYVNNDDDDAHSFISGVKLLKKGDADSAGMTLFENSTDRIYRMMLKSLMTEEEPYSKIWTKGYSSAESKIILGKPVTEDRVVIIEITYL